MPGLSKVIVLDPDVRAGRQLELGFAREAIPAAAVPAGAPSLELPGDDTGLVVVGGAGGEGLALVRRARGWLDDHRVDVPIVFTGRGVAWHDATAAGADEAVRHPAHLRDVVTIGRLLRGVPSGRRDRVVGSLVDVTSVFTLVRALAALGRSATLTLVRGLRRGEVRFYRGEVTSAQVGMIHGQAALHQLLLWTDARFDFHHEDIVRRQQIPLQPDELFADAERFLDSVRASSGGLSPAMVLEQDIPRVQSLARQIPTEVHGVLRMFDGHHVLADVLEDSPYRVFETLRVARRAVDAGLLRAVANQPPRPRWRTVLPIEDWLIGGEPREAAAPSAPAPPGSGPPPARGAQGGRSERGPQGKQARPGGKRRKKKRRADTPPPVAAAAPIATEIDWGALVPRIVGAEVGPLAGVVPASHVSGEITAAATRARRPSGAAAVSGTPDRPAPAGGHAEPTIVFDETAELARDTRDTERIEPQPPPEPRAHAEAEPAGTAAHERAGAAPAGVSSEPADVADDLWLGDTRPERRSPADDLAPSAGADAGRSAAPAVVQGSEAIDISEAITARMAAVPVPESAEAAEAAGAPPASPRPPDPADAPSPATADEPSDGVVRHRITATETTPVKRRRRASDPVDDDRPGDTTGEITMPRARPSVEIRHSEPSILISDLAGVPDEDAGATEQPAAAPPSHGTPVAEPRDRAAASSDHAGAAFRARDEDDAGTAPPQPEPRAPRDEARRPFGFWRRLRRKSSGSPRAPGGPDKK